MCITDVVPSSVSCVAQISTVRTCSNINIYTGLCVCTCTYMDQYAHVCISIQQDRHICSSTKLRGNEKHILFFNNMYMLLWCVHVYIYTYACILPYMHISAKRFFATHPHTYTSMPYAHMFLLTCIPPLFMVPKQLFSDSKSCLPELLWPNSGNILGVDFPYDSMYHTISCLLSHLFAKESMEELDQISDVNSSGDLRFFKFHGGSSNEQMGLKGLLQTDFFQ